MADSSMIVPDDKTGSALMRVAQQAFAAGLLPKGETAEQAYLKMVRGLELGIPPLQAIRDLYVVNNRVAAEAKLLRYLVRRSGKYGYSIDEWTNEACQVSAWPYEHPEERVTFRFTIEDAKRAGLLAKDPWQKWPADMLLAKATARVLNAVAPDATGGLMTIEELSSNIIRNADGSIARVLGGDALTTARTADGIPDIPPHPDTGWVWPERWLRSAWARMMAAGWDEEAAVAALAMCSSEDDAVSLAESLKAASPQQEPLDRLSDEDLEDIMA